MCVSVKLYSTVLYKDRRAHRTVISINWKYQVCLLQLSLSSLAVIHYDLEMNGAFDIKKSHLRYCCSLL